MVDSLHLSRFAAVPGPPFSLRAPTLTEEASTR